MNRWDCYKVNLQEANKVFFTTKVPNPDVPGEFVWDDRDHAADVGLSAGQWYHLAVSFGGGHIKFYIDGVLVKDWDNVPNANIVDISADPHNLVFGQAKPTSEYADETDPDFFKGKMDDIRIYNRVLNDDEVVALFELPDVDLEYGLVASYPFNGDATNASGNGNDGTVTAGFSAWGGGTPTLTTDRAGSADQAYYFDQGGNIEVPYSTILNPGSISLSWWIYMEERPNNDYMISMNRWDCYKVNLQEAKKVFFTTKVPNPDVPGEFVWNDRDHAADVGLSAETWYHLAVSFGGGHLKVYVDDVMVKDCQNVPNANIVDISADPHNLVFGQAKPTTEYADETDPDFFKGKMDDIRIYNRVLNDDEVVALFGLPVSVEEQLVFNRTFELSQNYPNPFKLSTTIEFSQQEKGFATLKVYNANGQEVATLVSKNQIPGNYKYIWDASKMSAGVYFYRLSINGYEQTKKLFIMH